MGNPTHFLNKFENVKQAISNNYSTYYDSEKIRCNIQQIETGCLLEISVGEYYNLKNHMTNI